MLHRPTLYSFTIWLTAVIFGPLLFSLVSIIYSGRKSGIGFEMVPYAWIFGGMLSIPSFIALLILNNQLVKRRVSSTSHITILLVSCTVLAILAFSLLSFYFGGFSLLYIDFQYVTLIGSYLISLYAAILFGLFSAPKKSIDTLDASELTVDKGA